MQIVNFWFRLLFFASGIVESDHENVIIREWKQTRLKGGAIHEKGYFSADHGRAGNDGDTSRAGGGYGFR